MADIGPYHRRSAPISAFTDFAVQLSGVALALTPAFEQVILVGIELASTQWSRSGQRRLWRLPEVLSDSIASDTKFFPNLAQAHPGRMQLLHPLIQLPFAQEACLRLVLAGRSGRKRGQRFVWHLALPRRGFLIFPSNVRANQERFHGITQIRKDVPPIRNLRCLRSPQSGSIVRIVLKFRHLARYTFRFTEAKLTFRILFVRHLKGSDSKSIPHPMTY